jgi:FkbM family methyltransferase
MNKEVVFVGYNDEAAISNSDDGTMTTATACEIMRLSARTAMWKPRRLYSQNFEDLYLYRLFCNIEHGFYIDAGAWDPDVDSVTKIFYENGWRGINLEPLQECYESLLSKRPEDINLCFAVVDEPSIGFVELAVVGDRPSENGLHFLLNSENADASELTSRNSTSRTRRVAATTLREVIERYARPRRTNFLKLDIEGAEYNAILGLSLATLDEELKPEVILLEATLPVSRLAAPHRSSCRQHLEGNGYTFLYFDGLNDYYCRDHLHSSFIHLMLPPNIFDVVPLGSSLIFNNLDSLATKDASINSLQVQMADEFETSEILRKQLAALEERIPKLVMEVEENQQALALEKVTAKLSREEMEKIYISINEDKDKVDQALISAGEQRDLFRSQLHRVQEELEAYSHLVTELQNRINQNSNHQKILTNLIHRMNRLLALSLRKDVKRFKQLSLSTIDEEKPVYSPRTSIKIEKPILSDNQ